MTGDRTAEDDRVTSEDTRDALKEVTGQIVDAVHSVLERTPPELAADVVDGGSC